MRSIMKTSLKGILVTLAISAAAGNHALAQSADTVFEVGTGVTPNPVLIDPNSANLNPAFALGSITSFPDLGTWAASQSYSIGDQVTFNGLDYLAVSNHTSGASFSADATSGYWILRSTWATTNFNTSRFLGLSSYSSKGAWSSSSSYVLGDMVTWNGVSYVCASGHSAGSSFTSDVSSGNWVMRSSCPSLSNYSQDTPVGATCEDFDAYFQSGTDTFKSSTKVYEANVAGSGVPVSGTLDVSITFDWDAETVSGTGSITLDNYPNIKDGGTKINMSSVWSGYSFHQNNTCGRFKLFTYSNYPIKNTTCYSSTTFGFDAHVNFHERDNKFIPVIHFTPPTEASPLDNVRFYNAAFGSGSCFNTTTQYNINAERGNMK